MKITNENLFQLCALIKCSIQVENEEGCLWLSLVFNDKTYIGSHVSFTGNQIIFEDKDFLSNLHKKVHPVLDSLEKECKDYDTQINALHRSKQNNLERTHTLRELVITGVEG